MEIALLVLRFRWMMLLPPRWRLEASTHPPMDTSVSAKSPASNSEQPPPHVSAKSDATRLMQGMRDAPPVSRTAASFRSGFLSTRLDVLNRRLDSLLMVSKSGLQSVSKSALLTTTFLPSDKDTSVSSWTLRSDRAPCRRASMPSSSSSGASAFNICARIRMNGNYNPILLSFGKPPTTILRWDAG